MCVISDSKAVVESAKAWAERLERKRLELAERFDAMESQFSRARQVAQAAERAERNANQVLARQGWFAPASFDSD